MIKGTIAVLVALLLAMHAANGDPPTGCICYATPSNKPRGSACNNAGCSVGNDDGNCYGGYVIYGNGNSYHSCVCPGFNVPTISTITVPNITVPTIPTPTITIRNITVPTITISNITTPTFTIPNMTTPTLTIPNITTPTITIPNMTIPTITIPNITTPTFTIPNITTPTVTIRNITVPTIAIPNITTPTFTIPNFTVPSITTPTMTIPNITVPTITNPIDYYSTCAGFGSYAASNSLNITVGAATACCNYCCNSIGTPIIVAPGGTTTVAPGGTTTAAPGGTTTVAPGSTTTVALRGNATTFTSSSNNVNVTYRGASSYSGASGILLVLLIVVSFK